MALPEDSGAVNSGLQSMIKKDKYYDLLFKKIHLNFNDFFSR